MSGMTITAIPTLSLPTAALLTAADRAEAGRRAIKDCPFAFDELRGDGDSDLVDYAASIDENVLHALETIGELSGDDAPLLGKFLAEQLVEDALEAEARTQLGAYRAARLAEADYSDDAYEVTDPKHSRYLERLGL